MDPILKTSIGALHELREQIASKARLLAERELDGRVLRLTVETELRTAGQTQTAAEKNAKVAERYLAHERESIRVTFDRALLEADAEAALLDLRLEIASLEQAAV